jgi:glycosyltransferase involved in cell wall biosynthesis
MRLRDSLLSVAEPDPPQPYSGPRSPLVEIVIPVRNEDRDLVPCIRRLRTYLREEFPFAARITIADNGSTDGTWAQALALAGELPLVHAVRLERPGRGGALCSIWSASDADVYAYMDVDLSTYLNALLPLLAPLLSGHSDVAIGTRLAHGARVIRGPRRETISRCYNLLLHATLGARFSDAQCGFQGDPGRRRPAAAAADGRPGLVLRHRAAGAGGAGGPADPRGAGGLDRRSRLPFMTTSCGSWSSK